MSREQLTRAEIKSDIKAGVVFALGGLAMVGGGVYAAYETIKGNEDGWQIFGIGSGALSGGAAFVWHGARRVVQSVGQLRSYDPDMANTSDTEAS